MSAQPVSQYENQLVKKAGEVTISESKKGRIKFYAYNHQQGRRLHIGTLSGAVYEKVAPVLRQPEPSFSLTLSELGAVEQTGAEFIRVVLPDKSATYSISARDFRRFAEAYYHAGYGPQMRCALTHFSHVAAVQKRSARRDNPVIETTREIRPAAQQLGLFRV